MVPDPFTRARVGLFFIGPKRFAALHTQTRFDVAQALAIGQLCEGHAEVLV